MVFTETVEKGSYLLDLPNAEKPTDSKTLSYLKEKLKTTEGIEYLGGSILGSGALIIATGGTALLRQPLKTSVKEIKIIADA